MKGCIVGTSLCIGLLFCMNANAIIYGGVDFPDGAASFADSVVSYTPVINGAGQPTSPYRDSSKALGVPDYDGSGVDYVSLGAGGSIVLRFTDNSLTGSGTAAYDLWIFEIGPDVEDTFVDISKNGSTWYSVGKVTGGTRGINIDAYGWGVTDFFSYVRLTDDRNEGATSGDTVGADIDAVGAISSAPPVSTPDFGTTLPLVAMAFCGLAFARRGLMNQA